MKLTSRDKELVILALSLGIVAASWLGGAEFINKKTAEVAAQKESLQKEYDERLKILEKKDEYIKDTTSFNDAYAMMLSNYPADISQVTQIMFVTELEEQFQTQVVSVSYSNEIDKYTFQSIELKNTAPYRLATADIQIPVTLTYGDWKRFLDYIFSYQNKSIIPNLSAEFDPISGMISATVTLNQYAIKGEDRILEEPQILVPVGTDNIFKSGTALSYDGGSAEQKEAIKKAYDCYIMLYPSASDVSAKVIAGPGETEKLISESNEEETLILTAQEQEEGASSVTCTLGGGKPNVFYQESKDTIDVYVLSTPRMGSTDLSGVKVQIDNQTTKKMRFAVIGDDKTRPRFVVESQSGDVQIFN